jgi:hypothetical protein
MPILDNASDDFAPRLGLPPERIATALERIASALERANELAEPAHEINAFNVKQLRAAAGGGIVPGTLIPGPGNGGGRRH